MDSAPALRFSIVIATFNRPERLVECLESLVATELPQDRFEVIVVDDGSEPPVAEALAGFSSRLPLRVLRQANSGCGPARNAGAREAKGRYLVFTDDDCLHPPEWLTLLHTAFDRDPDAAIGGRTISVLHENLYSSAHQLLVDYLFHALNANPREAHFLNSIAVPREPFLALSGFDPAFHMSAEDRDFCERWRAAGGRLLYEPSIRVLHSHHMSLLGFLKQQFRYGRGAFHFHAAVRRRENRTASTRPRARFYLDLLRFPFRVRPFLEALPLAVLFAFSQAAVTCGLLSERIQEASGRTTG